MTQTTDRFPNALMLQGTGSDVGKSMLVAGLCRAATNRGLTVRPFKPQNMSNNAAVTLNGGEVGRAQALQARAAKTPLVTDMNPVLLKPQTDIGAQVVVRGKVVGNAGARDYQDLKRSLMPAVLESFDRLTGEADLVVVEGAGSAAEVNLRASDIANMGFAEAAGVPVALVGDIDRGGVIAQLVGTWELLSESERALTAGFIVNKFRGDPSLFADGMRIVEDRMARPGFGLVPWFADASRLPREDAFVVENDPAAPQGALKIAVPVLSRIANFDDLDPLRAEPDVAVDMVSPGDPLPGDADLVILPGSKATLADLAFIRDQGWDIDLLAHIRRGGRVLGICGGYQMLGCSVSDPDGTEGHAGSSPGLGLLDVDTVLGGDKRLVETDGVDSAFGETLSGYEMHIGTTSGPDTARSFATLASGPDGAVSADGRVAGCYLHGLFAADGFRHAYLNAIRGRGVTGVAYDDGIDAALDALADHLEAHLDIDALLDAAAGYRNMQPSTTTAMMRNAR